MVNAPGSVRAAQLAALFDCSEKTVRQLADAGIVLRAGRGQYILSQSIRNYVKHLREQAAGRLGRDEAVDPARENALFKREQKRHYELKNAILEGSSIALDQIEPAWAIMCRSVRSGMLALSGRLRTRLPHLTGHDAATIDEEVRQVLSDASADPETPPAPQV